MQNDWLLSFCSLKTRTHTFSKHQAAYEEKKGNKKRKRKCRIIMNTLATVLLSVEMVLVLLCVSIQRNTIRQYACMCASMLSRFAHSVSVERNFRFFDHISHLVLYSFSPLHYQIQLHTLLSRAFDFGFSASLACLSLCVYFIRTP